MRIYTVQEPNTTSTSMDLRERWLSLLAAVLLTAALLIHLGQVPLRLEEPRRALIALEMLFNDNLIVPTEMGEFYYKKPPLYNWLIIGSYQLFGTYSEYAVRFFSVLFYLGMGALIFLTGKKYVGLRFGTYSALLFLISVDLLFYFTTTAGEIDLFYSFLTLASFFSIFHFYEQRKYLALFLFTYFFTALGTLTKGFPSIVFIGISLPVFFLYNRDFKRLFSWPHFAGIFLYLFIVAGYFWIYAQYNHLDDYFAAMWSQSSERTVLENSILSAIAHLFTFPFETLKNIAPAALLLLFTFRKDLWPTLQQNRLIVFCLFIFLSNIIVYWISPGTRSRYVYMLYPFPVMILMYAYLRYNVRERGVLKNIIFTRTITVLIILGVLACLALPFIPPLQEVGGMVWLTLLFAPACGILLWFHLRKPAYSLIQLILLTILLRLVFDFTVLPYRATHTGAYQDKLDAQAISELTHNSDLHLFEDTRFSLSTVFYIERERKQVLSRKYEQRTEGFYLADPALLSTQDYQIFYTFTYENREFLLIKFK